MTDLLDFTASPALDVAGTAADPAGAAQGLAVPPDGNGTADGPAHPAGTAGEAAALLACAEGMVRRVKTGGWSMSDLRKVSGAAGSLRSCLDSVVCDVTAAMTALSSKGRAAGVISEQTGMSKRDANRVANVAEGLASMPNTKKKLAEGKFTFGHAASLVNAAGAGGAEVIDNDKGLLAQAETKPADVFAGDAKRAALKASRDNGEAELDRQRKARRASLGKDRDSGMGFLHAELDPISHGLISQVLQTHADRLWRKDSKAGKTGSRSGVQRMADALLETITGLDALTHQPLPDTGAKNSRPQLIITADIGLINGQNPDGACEIIGTGPVPPSILQTLSPDTKLTGMIFSGDGRTLWLGTATRTPNAAQRLAITVRDRGCAQCGAPMHQCDIHHIRPWEQGGPTDIDNLQALCSPCHRQHHHDQDQKAGRQPRLRKKTGKSGRKNRKSNGAAGGTQGTIAMNHSSSGIQHRIPVAQIPGLTGTNRSPCEGQSRQARGTVGCSPAVTGNSSVVSAENLASTGASRSRDGPASTDTASGKTPASVSRSRDGPASTDTASGKTPAGAPGNREDCARSNAAGSKAPAGETRSRDGPGAAGNGSGVSPENLSSTNATGNREDCARSNAAGSKAPAGDTRSRDGPDP